MSSELVFPGDEVAIEEEYMGGEGTFSEDGTVYASQVGVLELDERVEDVFLIDGPALQNPEGVVQVENELIDALMNAA